MRRLLPLAGTALIASACTQHVAPKWIDPTSFTAQIVCADGDGAPACPAVPQGATTCPAIPPSTPLNLGTPTAPVSPTQLHYIVQVGSLDHNAEPYAFNGKLGVYVMTQGSVSPPRAPQSDMPMDGGQPLPLELDDGSNWVQMVNGQGCFGVTIPPSFGQSVIWVEDVPYSHYDPTTDSGLRVVDSSFALGASQPIYRPQPRIYDIQYTTDEIYTTSPLTNKYVNIPGGTNGAPLIVTSVSAEYFTITDLGQGGEDHAWGSLDVYSYSYPFGLHVGSTVSQVSGSVSPFDGLTELAFPIWTVVDANASSTVPLPEPHEIKGSDISETLSRMKPWESAVVVLKGWQICALTGSLLTSYQKYAEWAVQPPPPDGCAPGDMSQKCVVDCSNWDQSMEVVSKAAVPGFLPTNPVYTGKKLCSLTGVMTHVVPAVGVQLWIVNPRTPADLGTPVDQSVPCP